MSTTQKEMITKYDIAAIVQIYDDFASDGYVKLTAARQRELFGFAVIGRKSVNFDSTGQGVVRISATACFGTDGNVTRLSYEQFAQHINEQKKID